MPKQETTSEQIVNIDEVVDKLLKFDKSKIGKSFKPLNRYELPFFEGEFSLELLAPYIKTLLVVMNYESKLIGYKEFHGIIDVSPRMSTPKFSPGFSTYFDGFENHISPTAAQLMREAGNTALYVKKQFRKEYFGIGKAIATASLEIMKRMLKEKGIYKENHPMFMTKECSTDMYYKHFQAERATDYDEYFQDVVVFTNVICPPIEIKRKN